MGYTSYLPTREGDLLAWAVAFDTQINATPTDFGLTAAQAADYNAVLAEFQTAYTTATSKTTRTPAAVAGKNSAKEKLIAETRTLVNLIQATPGVTDEQKVGLGLRVRDEEPTPVPVPATAPIMTIVSTIGRTIELRLRDAENPDSRARPDGVMGATVMMYAGEEAPEDPMEWSFLASTSKTNFEVDVPLSVPANSKVHLSAFWYNTKSQSGPPCKALSTTITDAIAKAA